MSETFFCLLCHEDAVDIAKLKCTECGLRYKEEDLPNGLTAYVVDEHHKDSIKALKEVNDYEL